jgi:hypothetical protein
MRGPQNSGRVFLSTESMPLALHEEAQRSLRGSFLGARIQAVGLYCF